MKSNKRIVSAVIGAGLMGHGIALSFALAGLRVNLVDIKQEILQSAKRNIRMNLRDLVKHKIETRNAADSALAKIAFTQDLTQAAREARFIIEAVTENVNTKRSLFMNLEEYSGEDTIFATNTSGISINDLASGLRHPERLVGMHWWNPPLLMPLIEVIPGPQTSKKAVEYTVRLSKHLGKIPVTCKDSPGHLGVRIQAALSHEALRVYEEGIASAEDIDTAVRLSLGLRLPIMGPLQMMDFTGAHVALAGSKYLYEKLGDRFAPSTILKENVENGKLGVMSGEGIYKYGRGEADRAIRTRDEWLFHNISSGSYRKRVR